MAKKIFPLLAVACAAQGREAIEKAKTAARTAARLDSTEASECVRASRKDLEALLLHPRELLKEKAAELSNLIKGEAGLFFEYIRGRISAVEQIISQTAEGVGNAVTEGKLLEAAEILKRGKEAVDEELSVIVEEAEEAKEMKEEETAAEAEALALLKKLGIAFKTGLLVLDKYK